MRHVFMTILLVSSLLLMACISAYAVGGIYFDDLSVTNNGTSVFSDNFDDGSISDWTPKNDAALSSSVARSAQYSVYLNQWGSTVADAFHSVSIATPGVVEASVWVWLPPTQEQYRPTSTYIYLYSGNPSDNMYAGIELRDGETGYRVKLGWNGVPGDSARTSSVVLAPQTWAKLTLRLNAASGNSTAYALLNDQTQLSFWYTPSTWTSVNKVSFWGWLGGASEPTPEPSSLLALLSGAGGLVAFARRRARR
jgi:hypothetical protein